VAGVLYFLEFFADKIPWVDSIWDAVHTIIRPIGGTLLAIQVLGHPSPAFTVIVALLAGGTSLIAHTAGSYTSGQQHLAGTILKHRAKSWRRRCRAWRVGPDAFQSPACPDHSPDRHRRVFLFCTKNFTSHESEDLAGMEKTKWTS